MKTETKIAEIIEHGIDRDDTTNEIARQILIEIARSASNSTEQPSGAAAEEQVYGNDCKDDSCS